MIQLLHGIYTYMSKMGFKNFTHKCHASFFYPLRQIGTILEKLVRIRIYTLLSEVPPSLLLFNVKKMEML